MSEYSEVERPFLDQLAEQGWTIVDQGQGVPQDPQATWRSSFRQWVLPQVFDEAVRAINTANGETWLTDAQLDDLRGQLTRLSNRSLLEANEAVQSLLFKAQVDLNHTTGEADPVVKLIDFDHPEANRFHAVNQFRIDTPGCAKAFIIPDIVLFVNGIPLVVVECKKSSVTTANPMQEAFVQLQRYMNRRPETAAAGLKEGEPRLFHSNLIVVRTCGTQADAGTITSGEEHFYAWKTLYPAPDSALETLNAQQKLVSGMLTPPNLLRLLRSCSVFQENDDGTRIKVVARYQQFRAAGRIVERLRAGSTAMDRSGVVWHTQGSGKSLTMVFLARMIRSSPDLSDYKIVLVNDRQDLEIQLGRTARLIGAKVHVIDSTHDLRTQLATDSSDLNMVMVHKFQERDQELSTSVAEALGFEAAIPAAETFGVVNASPRIVLLIDEAHRTQSSDLGNNLFEAFPNAARVAFTGTPLITERHGEHKTHKRFGQYIDTYKLMDAVDDGTTLQILYEGKTADSALNEKHAFDQAFEDLFRDRTEEELAAIKKKYGATGDILEAENRINAIARDLVRHYVTQILPNGFKAQVVCHSKLACVRYQTGIRKALAELVAEESTKPAPDADLVRRLRFLKTAAVFSSDSVNEPALFTEVRKEAIRLDAVTNFCKPFAWAEPAKANTGVAFLIVCDMLLTGFDAPVEQVMYIDKKLKEHSLLQAIARTNRVKKGKSRGYIVDYIGLANHLTEALTLYAATGEQQELAALANLTAEIPVLEERYQRLVHFFRDLGVKRIAEFVIATLEDPTAEVAVVQAALRALRDERRRADFEVYFKKFLNSLDIVLPQPAAQPYRVPAKRFGFLLQLTKERYKDDSIDWRDAGAKVKALINEHLISLGINPKIPPIELLSEDFLTQLKSHSGDPESRASEMEHAIRKHCTVHHDEDPAFYQNLSQKVDALIEHHKEEWELLVEKLAELRSEALAGRTQGEHGMSREVTVFFDHVTTMPFVDRTDPGMTTSLKTLLPIVVTILRDSIARIDFWRDPDKQKQVRAAIKTEIAKTANEGLKQNRERLAVEILKLAKNRHQLLLQSSEGDN